MKLIYIYMEKFRNFRGQYVAFTDSYRVMVKSGDGLTEGIHIERGRDDKAYQQNIHSIHAIVGRNATGKTNIADIIGMLWDSKDRAVPLSENAAYFLLYAARDRHGGDIYYAEIVGLHCFAGIFQLETPASRSYGQYAAWFRYDPVGHKLSEIQKAELPSSTTGNCTAILSLREKFGPQHYFDVEGNKYSSQGNYVRRLGHSYASKNISDQVRAFWRIADNHTEFMQGRNQCLSVRCSMNYLDSGPGGRPPLFRVDHAQALKEAEYSRLRIAEAWLKFLLETAAGKDLDLRDDLISYLEKGFAALTEAEKNALAADYGGLMTQYMEFAFEYMEVHAGWPSDHVREIREGFSNFLAFPLISCGEDSFDIPVGAVLELKKGRQGSEERKARESRKAVIADFLNKIFDSGWAESGGFSKPMWINTSDGEQAYLLTFTAIEKILDGADADCRNNILLLDEPEIHMHPDLSRRFVKELLKWLRMRRGRKYQIILITHSPFLLSDIERHNVQYIEKCVDGSVLIRRPKSQTFAANIHDILSDAIILDSPYGEFARQEIKNALRQLQKVEKQGRARTDKTTVKHTLQKLSGDVGEQILAKQLEFLGESV